MTHPDDRLFRRAFRTVTRPAVRRRRRRQVRSDTGRLIATEFGEPPSARLADDLTVVSTFRVDSADRLRMLQQVVRHVESALGGSGLRACISDASPAAYEEQVSLAWQSAGLSAEIQRRPAAMADSLLEVLRELDTPWFYLQFDDQLTVGLSTSLLSSATALLKMCGGSVDVVLPYWPVEIHMDESAREIQLVSHIVDETEDLYRFGPDGPPVRPIRTFDIGGHRFGIFENFTYGFFVNHLIANAANYRRRLEWYMHHVDTSSVHRIENAAASGLRGPTWSHVAVCLDGVALLDLDYAHTSEAVRQRAPENERQVLRLEDGWTSVAAPKHRPLRP